MTDAWQEYRVAGDDADVSRELTDAMTSALDHLQTASQAKDAATTLQASNDVSAAVINLFALYNPKIPPILVAWMFSNDR